MQDLKYSESEYLYTKKEWENLKELVEEEKEEEEEGEEDEGRMVWVSPLGSTGWQTGPAVTGRTADTIQLEEATRTDGGWRMEDGGWRMEF